MGNYVEKTFDAVERAFFMYNITNTNVPINYFILSGEATNTFGH